MRFKALQWNIGGGKIRKPGSDPVPATSYVEEGLDYICEIIAALNPDIVTLQETHTNSNKDQVTEIARVCGFPYYFNHPYEDSHIEAGQRLGQAVLSNQPIIEQKFTLLWNPNYRRELAAGQTIVANHAEKALLISHDKGISSCVIQLDEETALALQTLHLLPFRLFQIDPLTEERTQKLREDITAKIITDREHILLQGDFNFDNQRIEPLLPKLFKTGFKEIPQTQPTYCTGSIYDHVLYKDLQVHASSLDPNALTDHYPIITEFEA